MERATSGGSTIGAQKLSNSEQQVNKGKEAKYCVRKRQGRKGMMAPLNAEYQIWD